MDPAPSVYLAQERTILINACVVEDFGIAPNWLSPIFLRIDGRKYSATTNSSATLERMDVNEMGRRCLFTSLIGFCFGIGTVSADFQEGGKRLSAKELLMISDIVLERRSAFLKLFIWEATVEVVVSIVSIPVQHTSRR